MWSKIDNDKRVFFVAGMVAFLGIVGVLVWGIFLILGADWSFHPYIIFVGIFIALYYFMLLTGFFGFGYEPTTESIIANTLFFVFCFAFLGFMFLSGVMSPKKKKREESGEIEKPDDDSRHWGE